VPGDDGPIISIRDFSEIPEPHQSRSKYREIVETVLATGAGREVVCRDRDAGRVVYTGLMRSVERIDAEDAVKVAFRTNANGTVSVFIDRTGPK
jgi:hypothetical protein